jgi:hypothetical protein
MTNLTPFPTDGKRDALRARIEAAERRNAERTLADQARAAATAAVDYTRANPLMVIGGALAAGLVIGLLTRPGRRVAGQALHKAGDAISDAATSASSSVKGVAKRGGSQLGMMLGEAVMAYVMTMIDEAIEAARTGQERAEDLGDAAGVQARKIKSSAVQAAETAATSTKSLARNTREAAGRMVADIARKTKG